MSGRDNATRYAKQWVVYFDDDLKDTAKAVADKKGNVTVSLTRYGGGEDSLPSTAFAGVVANSRLVILGHGDEKSTSIGYKNISAKTLAECIGVWLGKNKIERIVLMGGAFEMLVSEYNIRRDRTAAEIVFRSGVPITAVGLDVTTRCKLQEADIERLRAANNPGSAFLARLIELWQNERPGQFPTTR